MTVRQPAPVPDVTVGCAGGRAAPRPGQATVEAALALPFLLILLLGGLLIGGHLVHARQVVTGAAQAGARVSSAEGRTLAEGVAEAQALLRAGLGRTADRFAVEAGCQGGVGPACAGGTAVSLRVRGDYPLAIPWLWPVSVPLAIEVSMFREGLRSGR